VLKPTGVTRAALGRALPEHRAKGEVGYFDLKKRTGPCVYPPKVGEQVPLPDGQFNLEGFEAHGGWIASAEDLVRFAAAFSDPAACKLLSEKSIETMWERPKLKEKDVYYGCGWQVRSAGKGINVWHNGLIPGTAALMVRRHDGLVWAVLFNASHDPDGKFMAEAIDPLVHKAADEVAWK
jgi:N-acyl-D-amino-acid deacylase